jgi:hypothetical protein
MGLTLPVKSDPKNLYLTISQAQDSVGLTNIPDLKNLSLTVSQAQKT